jgi:DNA-binding transcriptional ArsR family regulator
MKNNECTIGLEGIDGLLSMPLFKALGDQNRLSILKEFALRGGRECSVKEIAQCLPVDLSVVSRHLGVLRDAGILASTRKGKEVYYRVQVEWLVGCLRGLADLLERFCVAKASPDELPAS